MSKIKRIPFGDIFYFKEVSRLESISKTAKRYKITKEALTHCLEKVNKFSDQRMFDRVGDTICLTEKGRIFLQKNGDEISSYYNTTSSILVNSKAVRLKDISVFIPFEFASVLIPMIEKYMTENKEVNISVHHNDRVSLENIFAYDIICHQSLDALIRLDSFSIYKVLPLPRVLCAAPEYIKKFGTPKNLKDLVSQKHQFIDNIIDKGRVKLISPDKEEIDINYNSIISVNNLATYFSYVFSGKGIGVPSSAYASKLIASGRLVKILSEYTPQTMNYFLMLSDIKPIPKHIEDFAQYLLQIHENYRFIER